MKNNKNFLKKVGFIFSIFVLIFIHKQIPSNSKDIEFKVEKEKSSISNIEWKKINIEKIMKNNDIKLNFSINSFSIHRKLFTTDKMRSSNLSLKKNIISINKNYNIKKDNFDLFCFLYFNFK